MRLALILFLVSALSACGPGDEPAAGPAPAATAAAAGGATGAGTAAAADTGPVATPITEVPPAIDVTAEVVAYGSTADSVLDGYLVLPADVVEPAPGIIMIHDEWGLDATIQALARRLAGEGYAVLAVDLFGGRTATAPGEAEILLAGLAGEPSAVPDNLRQAHDFLRESAVAPRIALLGFGFGGDWSLETAIELGDSVDAVVTFYGQVINDQARLEGLNAPLLGLFAAQDDRIPVREATRYRSTLRDLDKTAIVLIYSGVSRGFADPARATYAHEAATESWASTLEFLRGQLLP